MVDHIRFYSEKLLDEMPLRVVLKNLDGYLLIDTESLRSM